MLKLWYVFVLIPPLVYSCKGSQEKNENASPEKSKHLVHDIAIYNDIGEINAIIEIPAGSHEKWEVDKKTGQIVRDSVNGSPRRIDYLGYPANYGFIPQTLLSKELGGDGDPLDAIILGTAKPRGTIVSCRLLGVLKLEDNGEQDDKLILADTEGPMTGVNSLRELEVFFPNVLTILKDWFTNYKGPGQVISYGYADKGYAEQITEASHNQFIEKIKK